MGDENANNQAGKAEGSTEDGGKGSGEKFRLVEVKIHTVCIVKIQIRPRKVLGREQEDAGVNFSTRLPVLKSKAAPYVPMPYIFRVPSTPAPTKIKNLKARSPPFYLLLDHAIAVIWLTFAEQEYDCPLGIAQLQWASSFLKTIHTRHGDHPKDVELCIDAIEEILLNQYAELSQEMSNASKLDETVTYIDGALGPSTMVSKNIPFSLNYSEMTQRSPTRRDMGLFVHQAGSMTSADVEEQLDNIKKAAGTESLEKLDSVSKEKAINVLRMWKWDQMEKIRGELRRLRSIEDRMKNVDMEYVSEDDIELLLNTD